MMNRKIEELIKELRLKKGFTQEKVAGYLNISQRSYSDYESGKTHISTSSLVLLAKLYDVDMNYICGITDEIHSFPEEKKE